MTADTYSTDGIGILIMGTGNDNNTWGTNLNTNDLQILVDAITNALTSGVTGGTLDLSGSPPPAASSQTHYAGLIFTGVLGSNQTVQVPNLAKWWAVKNATSGAFTLKFKTPSGSASTAIPQNSGWQTVYCDGSNNIVVWPFNTGQIQMPDGSASAPAYSDINETNSGWYRNGTQDWRISINGADVLQITGTGAGSPSIINALSPNVFQQAGSPLVSQNSVFKAASGAVGAPGYSWNADTASGLYRIGANDYGYSVNSTKITEWTQTTFTVAVAQTVAGKASFTSTDSIAVANGTTGQRNGSPSEGDLRYNSTLKTVEFWNGTSWVQSSGAPRGWIDGLTLSNDGGTPNTIMDIAAGLCRSDDDTVDLRLTSAFTKTSANFAVGSANGGLDTGSFTASTWYFFFLIYNPTTLVTDVLFSASLASPTMPSGYTKKRYIGAAKTDASVHWLTFVQVADEFLWKASVANISDTAPGDTNAHLVVMTVPTGIKVTAICSFTMKNGGALGYVSSPDQNDEAPSITSPPPGAIFGTGAAQSVTSGIIRCRTDTSGQLRYRMSSSNNITVVSYGWVDQRGKNA